MKQLFPSNLVLMRRAPGPVVGLLVNNEYLNTRFHHSSNKIADTDYFDRL